MSDNDTTAAHDHQDHLEPGLLDRVAGCVARVLALERGQITPGSRLIEDLEADSLDLVELMYLLEQEFDITLSQQDMSLSAQLGLPEDELHREEVLTARALELLRVRFPKAGSLLVEGIERKHLAALITVEAIARSVQRRVGASEREA